MKLPALDPETTIRYVLLIICIKLATSSLESLYNYKIYKSNQLLSWVHIKSAKRVFSLTKLSRLGFDRIFAYPNILFLITTQLIFTTLTILSLLFHKPVNLLVITITFLSILIGLRNTYSNNGADQLSNIILLSLSISTLEQGSGTIRLLSIIFIAFQIELSYLTSGVYKLIGRNWKTGDSLKGILSTGQFGNGYVKRAMDKNPVTYILSSFVIIFGEILLGLAFLFPPELCLFMLFIGTLFHLSVAIMMGFNTFFWTFLSSYPAIFYVSLHRLSIFI